MWRLLALGLVGCGRIAFTPLDDGGLDAPISPCLLAWFSGAPTVTAPTRISTLSTTGNERDAFLSSDGLTLWFARDGIVVQTTRPDRASMFSAGAARPDLQGPAAVLRLTMRPDELEVFQSRQNAGSSFDLWHATRPSTSSLFGAGSFVTELDTAADDYDPELSADGLRLYWAPSPSVSLQDIVVASRATLTSPFGSPVALAGITTAQPEGDPTLSPDERLIVFARSPGTQDYDLRFATRASAGDTFGADLAVPNVNTGFSEGDPTLSDDGCDLIFTSNRGGDFDLYLAQVVP